MKSQTQDQKHIDTKHHKIRELINTKQIYVDYVESKLNTADIFTKPLPKKTFWELARRLQMYYKEELISNKTPNTKQLLLCEIIRYHQ